MVDSTSFEAVQALPGAAKHKRVLWHNYGHTGIKAPRHEHIRSQSSSSSTRISSLAEIAPPSGIGVRLAQNIRPRESASDIKPNSFFVISINSQCPINSLPHPSPPLVSLNRLQCERRD